MIDTKTTKEPGLEAVEFDGAGTLYRQGEMLQETLSALRAAEAKLESLKRPKTSVWVLTREINDYSQDGEYLVKMWADKPTSPVLIAWNVPESKVFHVLNGGGKLDNEDTWFHLKEHYLF